MLILTVGKWQNAIAIISQLHKPAPHIDKNMSARLRAVVGTRDYPVVMSTSVQACQKAVGMIHVVEGHKSERRDCLLLVKLRQDVESPKDVKVFIFPSSQRDAPKNPSTAPCGV